MTDKYFEGMNCKCPTCKGHATRVMDAETFKPGILCPRCGFIDIEMLMDKGVQE
jgi:Zn finger protein HypA/HybF involved in hydrogenase expression